MATTEAGGIVPQELRERIGAYFTWAAPSDGEEFGEFPAWDQLTEEDQSFGLRKADAILAEIAAAGYEIQPVARMNRLRWTARVACSVVRAEPGEDFSDVFADLMTCVDDMLQPGDLDRGEGRE
jgi:hypothetical protein